MKIHIILLSLFAVSFCNASLLSDENQRVLDSYRASTENYSIQIKIQQLEQTNLELEATNTALLAENAELKAKLSLLSTNSIPKIVVPKQ